MEISKKDKEAISARLHQVRLELGLSMPKMAEAAGVKRQTVNSWEKLNVTPNWFSIENLKKNLLINPRWIMLGQGDKFINKEVVEFMDLMDSPEFDASEVLQFAEFRASKSKR